MTETLSPPSRCRPIRSAAEERTFEGVARRHGFLATRKVGIRSTSQQEGPPGVQTARRLPFVPSNGWTPWGYKGVCEHSRSKAVRRLFEGVSEYRSKVSWITIFFAAR